MEQKRVGIWVRVSTEFQVAEDSPEVHEQRARYYIQSRDWHVAEVYRLDAISGKTVMGHPETQRMLNDIRRGHISGLVFSKLARLARNTRELLEFAEIFRAEGADLVSLAEQIDTSTPAGRLFFTMISAMAQWEREEISSRVAASVPIRAEMGKPLGGQASFGYKWHNKQLVIDEKEAPIRKLIYDIYLACQRRKTTADKLNALGHRTRNGSKFSDTTVERLLRDTTAKGVRLANYTKSTGDKKQWVVKPQEEWVQIPCPAIVDEQLWQECNSILDEQKQKRTKIGRKSEYLLGGLVKCACGKSMYVFSTARKFTCKACKNSIDEAVMNDIYQEHLHQYLNNINPKIFIEEVDAEIREQEKLLSSTIRKRAQLRKKMDDLVNLRLSGELDKEHLSELYKPIEIQVKQLDESIPELQAEIDYKRIQLNSSDYVLTKAKALYTEWADMQFPEKRAIAETVTEYITVGSDTINIALAYLPGSLQTSQRNFRDSLKPQA
ncbi:recombinase family protein [Pedobacter sp. KR3-3]|uniref:Recombinase family protein n=1 Tax=Pedobacter albus TaxID=3113905 RepID=A0ABU7IB48_9SPHI|nr:recombinase family protein [Pedobacter sp. KR3-3]MEE1946389.1 recombinase family protein [Pedobacter sp. KR3-3]